MPCPKPPRNRSQQGNILFLILLAIVLFAALSYAVTSSTRGGGNSAQTENYSLMASNILQQGALLESTIQRLMLTNECKETDLDFSASGNTGYTHAGGTPDKCKIFSPLGGNVPYRKVEEIINDKVNIFTYDHFLALSPVSTIGTTCTNAACTDLLWLLEPPATMDRAAFCTAYNKQATGSTTVPTATGPLSGSPKFDGTYSYQFVALLIDNARTGCYFHNSNGRYFIYYVLLAR